MPPICMAAAYGHYDLVKYLLEIKCRTNSKDKFKRSPLILAVMNGHIEIVSYLL